MKRLFDIIISLILIFLLLPVFVLTAYFVRKNLGSPIFFRQKRPGFNGRIFEMIKFRTMLDQYDCDGNLLELEKRRTKFGNKLRATSLDELPELFNVIKGDMSLVGPRPLLPEYLPLYNNNQKRRHEVRPGITGWAQTNGRNSISWKKKFKLDVWYVDNHNFCLDIKILFLTIKKVFLKDGVNSSDSSTMPKFLGDEYE